MQLGNGRQQLNSFAMTDEIRQVEEIRKAFEQEFGRFADLSFDGVGLADAEALLRDLNELKIKHTGKKSAIADAMKLIGKVAPEERGNFGQLVQSVGKDISTKIAAIETAINDFISAAKIERERLDVTIPGRRPRVGHLHPLTLLRQKIEDIFVSMGYTIEDDRESETDYYNFDALNIPEGHPARESQDTFYTTEGFALRSQTSTDMCPNPIVPSPNRNRRRRSLNCKTPIKVCRRSRVHPLRKRALRTPKRPRDGVRP